MWKPSALLSLPTSLVLLTATSPAQTSSQDLQWPYNLPKHIKYFPEDEPLIKRDDEIQRRLWSQPAAAVRKMSGDEGAKFFLDYWEFGGGLNGIRGSGSELETTDAGESSLRLRSANTEEPRNEWANATIPQLPRPPFALHLEEIPEVHSLARFFHFPRAAYSPLDRRDFRCPAGTADCSTINRPDSCCAVGETCQLIQDTGLGDVGCCNAGQTCSGDLTSCDPGQSSCPGSPNGGCCIPGFVCEGVGCIVSSTATVIVSPSPTSSSIASSSSISQATSTVLAPFPFPSASSSSSSVAPPSSTSSPSPTSPTTTTKTPAPMTCSSGFRSCPATLGGGCCPADRACGSASGCPPLSSTAPIGAPVRPTSNANSPTLTTTATPGSTITAAVCPTGFYQCSAYYNGGCCRVGRDCAKTSCPTSASTIVANTDGVTIIAPTGTGVGPANPGVPTGICASGWLSCAESVGGGCCPVGYACGTGTSCPATSSGVSAVPKEAPTPSGASSIESVRAWCVGVLLLVALMGVGVGELW